jgi:multiple sugar transport system substrate-binding protein
MHAIVSSHQRVVYRDAAHEPGLAAVSRRTLLTCLGNVAFSSVVGVGLAACGLRQPPAPVSTGPELTRDQVTLQVGYPWADALERFDDAATAFRQRYPNLRVERIAIEGNYNDKMFTMFAAGVSPDMMAANNDVVPDYAGRGMFVVLDGLMKRDNRAVQEYHPFPVRIYQYEGKQYLLPDSLNMTVIFVNKSLFEERGITLPATDFRSPEWTFDDVVQVGRSLTRRDSDRPVWGFYVSDWIGRWFPFLWGFGANVMDDMWAPKRWTFDSQQSVDTLQYLQDLVWKHRVMGSLTETTGQNSPSNLFQRGQLGVYLEVMSFNTVLQPVREFEWQIVPVPRGPAGRFNRMAGAGIGVSTQTKYINESWEFIKFLTGPEAPTRPGAVPYLAPHKGKMNSPEFLNALPGKSKQVIIDTLEYARIQPLHPKWKRIDDEAIRPELRPVFLNERSPREGVAIVTAKAKAILEAQ